MVYHGVTAEKAELLTAVDEGVDPGLREAVQMKRAGKTDGAQKRKNWKETFKRGSALIEE